MIQPPKHTSRVSELVWQAHPSWKGRDDGEREKMMATDGSDSFQVCHRPNKVLGLLSPGELDPLSAEPDTELGPNITHLLSILTSKKAL